MSAHIQSVFEHAVKHHVPSAFITTLERVDEFELGGVLVYHHKPHWWRRNELDFSGLPLQSLLAEGDLKSQYKIETEKTELFSATSDQSNRNVDIDLDLDADMKIAFFNLGGKLGGDGAKKVILSASLGAVNHIRSNLFQELYGKQYTVDLNHPVVKDAVAKGNALFAISAIYVSDKAEVKMNVQETVKASTTDNEGTDAAKKTDTATAAAGSVVKDVEDVVKDAVKGEVDEKGDAKAGTDVSTAGVIVTERDQETVIAFNVMKINVTKTGQLVPTDKSGFTGHHKVHFPYSDTFMASTEKKSTEDTPKGGATGGGATPKGGGATPKGDDNAKEATPKKDDAKEGGATPKDDQ